MPETVKPPEVRAIGWRAGWAFLATAVMFVAVGRIKRQSDH